MIDEHNSPEVKACLGELSCRRNKWLSNFLVGTRVIVRSEEIYGSEACEQSCAELLTLNVRKNKRTTRDTFTLQGIFTGSNIKDGCEGEDEREGGATSEEGNDSVRSDSAGASDERDQWTLITKARRPHKIARGEDDGVEGRIRTRKNKTALSGSDGASLRMSRAQRLPTFTTRSSDIKRDVRVPWSRIRFMALPCHAGAQDESAFEHMSQQIAAVFSGEDGKIHEERNDKRKGETLKSSPAPRSNDRKGSLGSSHSNSLEGSDAIEPLEPQEAQEAPEAPTPIPPLHQSAFRTDTEIASELTTAGDKDRQLQQWDASLVPEESLEDEIGRMKNTAWDQFEVNKRKFNVKSTYQEELYTTALDESRIPEKYKRRAEALAREIEAKQYADDDAAHSDEEDAFASVMREKQNLIGYQPSGAMKPRDPASKERALANVNKGKDDKDKAAPTLGRPTMIGPVPGRVSKGLTDNNMANVVRSLNALNLEPVRNKRDAVPAGAFQRDKSAESVVVKKPSPVAGNSCGQLVASASSQKNAEITLNRQVMQLRLRLSLLHINERMRTLNMPFANKKDVTSSREERIAIQEEISRLTRSPAFSRKPKDLCIPSQGPSQGPNQSQTLPPVQASTPLHANKPILEPFKLFTDVAQRQQRDNDGMNSVDRITQTYFNRVPKDPTLLLKPFLQAKWMPSGSHTCADYLPSSKQSHSVTQ